MIDRFLEGSKFYQFPSFEVAVYSLLLALVLSTCIAFTFKATFKGLSFPNSLFQAMILSSLVTSMIIMAVGNNIAVGFGIIGVVAIVRFRLQFQNPRNIIFLFAALSVGIATGVYGYSIALAGTAIFCLTALVLNVSKFQERQNGVWLVSYALSGDVDEKKVLDILAENCDHFHHIAVRARESNDRQEYLVHLKNPEAVKILVEQMKPLVNSLRCEAKEGNEL